MLLPVVSSFTLAPALTRDYLIHHRVCPKSFADDGSVVVAVANDSLLSAIDDISFAYDRPVATETMAVEELERLIERLTTSAERTIELARAGIADDAATDVRDLVNQPPVIRYVNLVVSDAYDMSASDIHLEATRSGLAARFRVDGVLVQAPEPPSQLHRGSSPRDQDDLFAFGIVLVRMMPGEKEANRRSNQ